MMASFCSLGMWKQVQILGLVVPPVVTPWVDTAGPFGVRLGVARCHTENRLAAALEGLIRIVGSGAAQAVNPPGGDGTPG